MVAHHSEKSQEGTGFNKTAVQFHAQIAEAHLHVLTIGSSVGAPAR